MSMKCEVCGKQPSFGNNVSHANNKTRRRWNPNLQRIHITKDGKNLRARVCAKCIRSGAVTKAA